MRAISEKDVMPNVRRYRDAFKEATQYGLLTIPANIGEEAYRSIDGNSAIYNTIVKPKPSEK
jgi:hypothetical protein